MITQELKQLVVDEALKLRELATKEEKEEFCKQIVASNSCAYMNSFRGPIRAKEMIWKCAEKPYSRWPLTYIEPRSSCIEKGEEWTDFSPIEYYIGQPGAKIEDLVKLIKS